MTHAFEVGALHYRALDTIFGGLQESARLARLNAGGKRLAIADPPYPRSASGRRRASRWYGSRAASLGRGCYPADFHPEAEVWDSAPRHRELIEQLTAEYDGWAIATSADGDRVYAPLPKGTRRMVWVKPNATPGPARIHSKYELVLLYPAEGRRSSRNGAGCVPDVLIAPKRNDGFAGAKPPEWTRWVLEALSYDPSVDTLDDLFHGSGAVATALGAAQLDPTPPTDPDPVTPGPAADASHTG